MKDLTNVQTLFLAHWFFGYDPNELIHFDPDDLDQQLNAIKSDVKGKMCIIEREFKPSIPPISKKKTKEYLGHDYQKFMAAIALISNKGESYLGPSEYIEIDDEYYPVGPCQAWHYKYDGNDYFESDLRKLMKSFPEIFEQVRQMQMTK